MDIHAPTCSRCSYRLPVTWTDPAEMRLVLECVGWQLDPAVCPECRRKLWRQREREHRRKAIVKNCGFWIVTDYVYPIACPICGEQMTQRKPTPKRRGNKKKSKGEK